MKKVYIGSENPVKIACTEMAFRCVFPDTEFSFMGKISDSRVNDQPMSDQETYKGARNRVENLKDLFPDGDFWVGIEGGVEMINDSMHAFAWMVVDGKNNSGEARTATFPLPERIKELVSRGMELGHADDLVFKRSNSKQKDGAVGILTGGIIDRKHYYIHAMILALIPFINTTLY
ncbi:MAG: inosine/xanthosine triphosphatase [Cyclobacteriaceae bacterium]|nr:inosine/xanthosine triphosphatase [Cyclobacteriaceae bacterium]